MAEQLASERIIIEAPLSFTGSAKRIWRLSYMSDVTVARIILIAAALVLITLAWSFVLCWYLLWGIWLVPYRLIRRSSRKQRRDALRHRELMDRNA